MKTVRLGKSELMVSQVGFGGIPIARISYEEAARCIDTAIDLGVNFFDTAIGYQDSEDKIGRAIQAGHRRDQVVIATKAPPRDGPTLERDLDKSLERLRTDYVDLYQFHNIRNAATLEKSLGMMDVLLKAKEQGKVRHIGATVHGVDWINQVIETGVFETVMIALNFIVSEAAEAVLPAARRCDVGVIAMKPMAGGHLTDARLAFKYFVGLGDAVVPLVGIQSPDEIREIVGIFDGGEGPTEAERGEMARIREETGDRFCRRCEYCMPCEHGVKIVPITIFTSLARRMSAKHVVEGYGGQAMKTLENCIQCGECEKRCPYDLDIQAIFRENYEYYKELVAQCGGS
ncbi:aldo/keto reductase [Candidatus Sumerlaeota bacterium]|nr:aldo/keto reductase [Candidatus Sumerlaeota bacterium]